MAHKLLWYTLGRMLDPHHHPEPSLSHHNASADRRPPHPTWPKKSHSDRIEDCKHRLVVTCALGVAGPDKAVATSKR
jgi:hypothetical protein